MNYKFKKRNFNINHKKKQNFTRNLTIKTEEFNLFFYLSTYDLVVI